MGKKLDRLLGRGFKVSKCKPLLSLALTRLTVLKAQRQARTSNSRSDVLHLLQLGHHERALLRVEQVVREQNMLDAYLMMESYCNLLIERVNLIEQEKECPGELKEAVSTLIYASSRCGEFPELLEIRAVIQSHFGKEFVARAIELRNNCGVNTKMIQKMSTLHPSLESRTKLLREIAAENGIVLHLDDDEPSEGKMGINSMSESPKPEEPSSSRAQRLGDDTGTSLNRRESYELSDSFKSRQKYKGVADAAQAAFESAAYAAAAARAAVELSRSSGPGSPSDPSSPSFRKGEIGSVKTNSEPENLEFESKAHARSLSSSSLVSDKELQIDANDEVNELPCEPVTQAASQVASGKQIPSRFQAGLNVEADNSPLHLNLENGPISVRNRRLWGY
ncbi:uncharacterized protein LOC116201894 [Punica granatum]|uniref:IST1 homolog n=2 Tax=Punica granatum TaxID=22663 RepID=A0A218XWL1_PUNGR|nr:uncharacterized protein LOC116201894 [Punica granatum]OWM89363.1 hypothetical protein CDL15_Pgr024111 [Punica granatum]PKI61938.1 hypothetical protein CRG98_017664 [Punica granatum]